MGLNFNPKDGDECIVSGNISLFVQRGNYQLIAKKMILAGQGNLMQEFEKLKSKLKMKASLMMQINFLFPKHQNMLLLLLLLLLLRYKIYYQRLKEELLV